MAKRFQFRFETMLQIRQQREDQQKRVVAARNREIVQVQERLAGLERQIHEETAAIRDGQNSGAVDIQQLMRHRHWLGHLHKAVLDAQSELRTLEAKLAQERLELAEAMKQRKILAKLKERQQERHMQEQQRRETRENDEMNTVRFAFEDNASRSLQMH
jgi:flagellar FliJ protein